MEIKTVTGAVCVWERKSLCVCVRVCEGIISHAAVTLVSAKIRFHSEAIIYQLMLMINNQEHKLLVIFRHIPIIHK